MQVGEATQARERCGKSEYGVVAERVEAAVGVREQRAGLEAWRHFRCALVLDRLASEVEARCLRARSRRVRLRRPRLAAKHSASARALKQSQ